MFSFEMSYRERIPANFNGSSFDKEVSRMFSLIDASSNEDTVLDLTPNAPLVARIWMSFDGTISSFIEAVVGERLSSVCLSEPTERPFSPSESWASANETALDRVVIRKGNKSNISYYWAKSTINLNLLPIQVAERLKTNAALGAILRDGGLDVTYERRSSRIRTLGELGASFSLPATAQAGELEYAICSQGKVIADIVECFPLATLPSA
jgi:hypothetical protein